MIFRHLKLINFYKNLKSSIHFINHKKITQKSPYKFMIIKNKTRLTFLISILE